MLCMAFDSDLVDRIRALLEDDLDGTDKRMFGGIAFLANGHMAVAANSHGRLMCRVDPDEADALRAHDGVGPMVMRGKELAGWVQVEAGGLDDEALAEWVRRGLAIARELPAH